MESNLIERIKTIEKEFIKKHKREPNRLYLTGNDEGDLRTLPPTKIGDLASLIIQYGPREAIKQVGNKFLGMEVIWDSHELKVE